MDLSSWIDKVEVAYPVMCSNDDECLSTVLRGSVATPSASNWSDMSIRDGGGSDEGDTFKYECVKCKFKCLNIEDLCAHLAASSAHVVCPVCMKEFDGKNDQEKEARRKDHVAKAHPNQICLPQTQPGEPLERNKTGLYGLEHVLQAATDLTTAIGFAPTHGPRPGPVTNEGEPETPPTNPWNAEAPIFQPANQSYGALSLMEKNRLAIDGSKLSKDGTPSSHQVNGICPHDGDDEHGKQTQSHSIVPYYHWEPDMQINAKLDGGSLERLIYEREMEMNWLRGFEGA